MSDRTEPTPQPPREERMTTTEKIETNLRHAATQMRVASEKPESERAQFLENAKQFTAVANRHKAYQEGYQQAAEQARDMSFRGVVAKAREIRETKAESPEQADRLRGAKEALADNLHERTQRIVQGQRQSMRM
jgi:hypothetical protein